MGIISLVCVAAMASATAQASAGGPGIVEVGVPLTYDAAPGGRGGMTGPTVHCLDGSQASSRAALVRQNSPWQRTFAWRGPRVKPFALRLEQGRYTLTTTADCGGRPVVVRHRFRVVPKSPDSTIDRTTFDEAQTGWSYEQVVDMVGFEGHERLPGGGRIVVTYRQLDYRRVAVLTFRDGRLVAKRWGAREV